MARVVAIEIVTIIITILNKIVVAAIGMLLKTSGTGPRLLQMGGWQETGGWQGRRAKRRTWWAERWVMDCQRSMVSRRLALMRDSGEVVLRVQQGRCGNRVDGWKQGAVWETVSQIPWATAFVTVSQIWVSL